MFLNHEEHREHEVKYCHSHADGNPCLLNLRVLRALRGELFLSQGKQS